MRNVRDCKRLRDRDNTEKEEDAGAVIYVKYTWNSYQDHEMIYVK
jgi:hypothetical protein